MIAEIARGEHATCRGDSPFEPHDQRKSDDVLRLFSSMIVERYGAHLHVVYMIGPADFTDALHTLLVDSQTGRQSKSRRHIEQLV